jgi:hypothetical protein
MLLASDMPLASPSPYSELQSALPDVIERRMSRRPPPYW